MESSQIDTPKVACDITAIPSEKRVDHQFGFQQLVDSIQETQELPNGYALRLPAEAEFVSNLMKFIISERDCCPFWTFDLTFEPQGGPFWLKMTGPEGTKDVVAMMIKHKTEDQTSEIKQALFGSSPEALAEANKSWK